MTRATPVAPIGRLKHSKIDVLGVPVDAIDVSEAVRRISEWIETGTGSYVCVTGVHGVMECQRAVDLQEIYAHAGLVVPDGMPLVWAGRYANAPWMNRVYGPDLMLTIMELSQEYGWRHYLYGGRPGVPELLKDRLQERLPRLHIVGTYSPPFRPMTDDEDDELVASINELEPHLIWVGISTPKQERWMAAHADRLQPTVLIGVGAAFDFHAGLVRQAPRWIQHSGLEWGFRLAHEPRRLWRRYLRNNPQFVRRILAQPPMLQIPFSQLPGTNGEAEAIIDLRG